MTGSEVPGKPSIGSWLSYGLGSESNDLPAFVVFTPCWTSEGRGAGAVHRACGASGFLPTQVQRRRAAQRRRPGALRPEPRRRRATRTAARCSTRSASSTSGPSTSYGDPETQTRIAQYEMAFRMQTSVPELTDLSKEPKETLDLYGPDVKKPGSFAASALLARRLVERGVRVVQILHRGWDQHGNLPNDTRQRSARTPTSRPPRCSPTSSSAACSTSTLVVWGGEFGRTVYSQGTLTKDELRPRPPPAELLHVAGRRRRQGRRQSTARPTTSATTSPRTRST